MRPIDIVIPIHDAREMTIQCVESVLQHARGDFRLVLADDASRDPELVGYLDEVARREPRAKLLRNPQNLGFVGTCNAAMAMAEDRDVLLLNSDTIATAGFLERLRECAYAATDTGIVSPLSNNATILSVPRFCVDNPIPAGHTVDSFADLIARASPKLREEIVTAVGFCMYIRAEVLARIGCFDIESFGRGYGEENDFCERALAAGFRIRVADDAFVYHAGGASFGAETSERQRLGADAMRRLHPDYFRKVAHFIETNPLRPVHVAIELALSRRNLDRPALLVIVHAPLDRPAGGTEHHLRELLASVRLPRAVVAVPDASGIRLSEVFDGDLEGAISYRWKLARPVQRFTPANAEVCAALERICQVFDIGAAHIHHLLYWPLDLWQAFESTGIRYALTTHDFYTICPSHNLVNSTTGRPCCLDEHQTENDRRRCIEDLFHHLGLELREPALVFRESHRREACRLVEHAYSLVFPSEAAAAIVRSRFAAVPPASRVLPHGYPAPPLGPRPRRDDERLQVAFLGEISYKTKGADNVLELLRRCRHLDVVWHVFGSVVTFGYQGELEKLGLGRRLVLHGPYERETIRTRLRDCGIDLAVLLPTWPETFSFTVSEALTAGVPVLVSRKGAPADRIEQAAAGFVVADVAEAAVKLQELARDRAKLDPAREAAERFRHRTLEEMAADYRSLYAELMPVSIPATASSPENARALVELHLAALDPRLAIQDQALPRLRWLRHPLVRAIARRTVPEPLRRRFRQTPPARAATAGLATPRSAICAFPLPGSSVTEELEPRNLRFRGRRYRSRGHDPKVLLPLTDPLETARIRAIEFDLSSENGNGAYAQIFWIHEEGEPFTEAKSVVVPLKGDGSWRTYTVEILRTDKIDAWRAGRYLRALRFDPLDRPGGVGLGSLRLLA